jgi:hypothetical protein
VQKPPQVYGRFSEGEEGFQEGTQKEKGREGEGEGEGDAEMRNDPDRADSGRRPSGCASHYCEVHTRTIIFGLWPSAITIPSPDSTDSYLIVSRLLIQIKHEHAEPTITSARPHHVTILAASIPPLPPICFSQIHFVYVHVIRLNTFNTSINSHDSVSTRRANAQC